MSEYTSINFSSNIQSIVYIRIIGRGTRSAHILVLTFYIPSSSLPSYSKSPSNQSLPELLSSSSLLLANALSNMACFFTCISRLFFALISKRCTLASSFSFSRCTRALSRASSSSISRRISSCRSGAVAFHSSWDTFLFSNSSHAGMERGANCRRGRSFSCRSAKRGGGGRSPVMERRGVDEERVMPDAGVGGAGSATVRGANLSGTRCSTRHPSEDAGIAAAPAVGGLARAEGVGLGAGPVGSAVTSTLMVAGPTAGAAGPPHPLAASESIGRGARVSSSLPHWTYRLPSGS
mmetsp:Transcript_29680/g.71741  ORF Transcript_29680/g.71741 Transcript_29680/m.71741 type:complete len:293 (+) Transcript_29680:11-889(+)